jgi:acyl carrier protein
MPDNLSDLAQILREDRLVRDAEVFDGPGPATATALIVPQGYSSGPVLRERVMRLANGTAGPLQVAKVQQIPRDGSGALDHARALAMMGLPGVVYRFEPPVTDSERSLAQIVRQLLPDVRASMTDALTPLGVDSLAAVELLALISERMGVELDAQQLYSAETLHDLAAMIDRAADAASAS